MLSVAPSNKIILASASPRRKELLGQVNLAFDVIPSEIEEHFDPNLKPEDLVRSLALQKAQAVASAHPSAIIIGADTLVAQLGEVFGKPVDRSDAVRMLKLFSGSQHQVWGGVAIVCFEKKIEKVFSYCTDVEFRDLSESEIESYVDSGEPFDKAGGYGIQGRAHIFVDNIKGSYSNVVGLATSQLVEELKKLGVL